MSTPVCTNCNNKPVDSADDVCADCQQEAIAALRFSSRLDPSGQHRIVEIRDVNVAAPDYFVNGDNAPRVIALYCLAQLAGMGFIDDDAADMIAQHIGNIPESEPLPWATPPLPVEAVAS